MHHVHCLKQNIDQKCYSCKYDLYEELYKDLKEQRKRDKKFLEKQEAQENLAHDLNDYQAPK